MVCFFLMRRLPPRSTRTDTLFPYTTLFRSRRRNADLICSTLLKEIGSGLPPPDEPPDCRADDDYRGDGEEGRRQRRGEEHRCVALADGERAAELLLRQGAERSEERRVGKECVRTGRSRWSPYH